MMTDQERNKVEVETLGVRHTIEVSKEQLEKIRTRTHFSADIRLDVPPKKANEALKP